MLGLSCDSRANIMVWFCPTQWEFWQKEATALRTYKLLVETNGAEIST